MRWIVVLGATCALTACRAPSPAADDTSGSDTDTDSDTKPDTDTRLEVPLPGWGEIAGACGALSPRAWDDPAPRLVANSLTLTGDFDLDLLSDGGQEVIEDGNLGGSSLESEAMSYEVLYRCELAVLLATEAEIAYRDDSGKKTDLLVEIDARWIGVSVTRAVMWPHGDPLPYDRAYDLLVDKLSDIPRSTRNVHDADRWERQVLHVLAWDDQHAAQVADAWEAPDMPRGDTVVVVTATNGDDAFIYE